MKQGNIFLRWRDRLILENNRLRYNHVIRSEDITVEFHLCLEKLNDFTIILLTKCHSYVRARVLTCQDLYLMFSFWTLRRNWILQVGIKSSKIQKAKSFGPIWNFPLKRNLKRKKNSSSFWFHVSNYCAFTLSREPDLRTFFTKI